MITVNTLTAANQVLIPLQCEYFALEGITQLLEIIDRVRKGLNPDLEVGRVILTLFDGRTNLANQVMQEVKSYFGDAVSPTVVPRNVKLSEAPSFGQPISLYDPKSKGAVAYETIAKELIAHVERKTGPGPGVSRSHSRWWRRG
jgi:chromosome partitioning protein